MFRRVSTNWNRLKNLIIYKNLDPIEFYTSDIHKINYIENAKVACTTIKKSMYNFDHNIGMELHQLLREHGKYKVPDNGYFTFTVVRNPLDRLVSCYLDKVKKNGDSKGKSIFDLLFYKIIFFVFSGIWYNSENITFTKFVHIICKTPDIFADRHIRSQYRILKKAEDADLPVTIIKIEELDYEWRKHIALQPLNIAENRNKTKKNAELEAEIHSTQIRNLIYERYKKDFDKFGYNI